MKYKPVVGYLNLYEVGKDGTVRNVRTRRMLKPAVHSAGYRFVNLSNGKARCRDVHRIVAESFIGPRPEGMQINHKDGNKLNNAADNLEYVTPKQNMKHARSMGFSSVGVRNGNAIIDG